MNNRERILACLNYLPCDRLPVVHFGFWGETWKKWEQNGEMTEECLELYHTAGKGAELPRALGFDCGYADDTLFTPNFSLMPPFETKVLRNNPDGSRDVLKGHGVVVRQCDGVTSIPAEVDHVLKDRDSWENEFLPRLQFHPDRVNLQPARLPGRRRAPFSEAADALRSGDRDYLYGLSCGSMIGHIRNYLGVENLAYLQVDDAALLDEIVAVNAELSFKCIEF